MNLLTFKTLWGHPDLNRTSSLAEACLQAVANGFQGIEGPVPSEQLGREDFAALLAEHGLLYIAEICTAGSYVPDRTASLQDHIDDVALQLARLQPLNPVKINCLGGCDRWDLDTSIAFFSEVLELADKYSQVISFETHRGRSLYSPWMAERILNRQTLPLTCDFSHWCVVCEGLGHSEVELIRHVAQHAEHIHGRIGYDQGPQVSDPAAALYKEDLEKHLTWWSWIWQSQKSRGRANSTLTPEFGPDGYQMVEPDSGRPVGDLNVINRWMAQKATSAFNNYVGEKA